MADREDFPDADSRLERVESKLTLAEDLLEALNRTVYRQQQHIDRLERELGNLREQLEASNAAAELGTPRDEVPPHY